MGDKVRIIDIKLVIDYVMGNDIVDYDIEELENDYKFMKKVIIYTNDKKMYNFCSEGVKNNYDFVKFLITKFNKDVDFIVEVADNYLKNSDDEYNKTELEIIMYNLLRNSKNINLAKYSLLADARYITKRVDFETAKYEYDEETMELLQLGFMLVVDSFSYSDIVMEYYAKRYINDILRESKIDIETLLHKNFRSCDALDKYDINKFIVELINQYDTFLGNYIFCHPNVLDELLVDINKIKKRWDIFEKQNKYRKYKILFDEIDKYFEENAEDFSFDEIEAIYYVSNKLGISKEIMKYADINDEHIIYLKTFFELTKNLEFKDLMHFKNIENIMIKCLEIESFENIKDLSFKNKYLDSNDAGATILDINEIINNKKHQK